MFENPLILREIAPKEIANQIEINFSFMTKISLTLMPDSPKTHSMARKFKKSTLFSMLLFMLLVFTLPGIRQIQAQTYGPPLFTEDFGTVPAGNDVNKYRGDISGRGTIGNIYWLWPATCSGSGWMTISSPTVELSYALTLLVNE